MFNLFFLAFIAIAIGAVIAVLITRKASPGRDTMLLPEDEAAKDGALTAPSLRMAQLYELAEALCRERSLEIVDRSEESPEEAYWVAKHNDPFFLGNYVFGFMVTTEAHPLVSLTDLLGFKDFVKGAESRKGFLLISGYFSRDVHQPLEGPNVTLFNRRKVLEERKARGL